MVDPVTSVPESTAAATTAPTTAAAAASAPAAKDAQTAAVSTPPPPPPLPAMGFRSSISPSDSSGMARQRMMEDDSDDVDHFADGDDERESIIAPDAATAKQKGGLVIPPVIITDVTGKSRQSSLKNSLRLMAHVRVS